MTVIVTAASVSDSPDKQQAGSGANSRYGRINMMEHGTPTAPGLVGGVGRDATPCLLRPHPDYSKPNKRVWVSVLLF